MASWSCYALFPLNACPSALRALMQGRNSLTLSKSNLNHSALYTYLNTYYSSLTPALIQLHEPFPITQS